jgi:hypothetical protein
MVRYSVEKVVTMKLNISFELGEESNIPETDSVTVAIAEADVIINVPSAIMTSLKSESMIIQDQNHIAEDQLRAPCVDQNIEQSQSNLYLENDRRNRENDMYLKSEKTPAVELNLETKIKFAGRLIADEEKIIGRSSLDQGISAQCIKLFEDLKIRRAHRYLILRIGDSAIEVETVGDRDETFKDLTKKLPFTECRYCVYDQDILTGLISSYG